MRYTLTSYEDKGLDPRGNHKLYAVFQEYQGGTTPVYWAVKNLPTIAQQFDGEITQGEYGPRFKREFAPESPTTATNYISGSSQRPAQAKDSGDGQRQGMAINNAAQYVLATKASQIVDTPEDWAKAVKAYAVALYNASDLTQQDTDLTDIQDRDILDDALGIQFDNTLAAIDGPRKKS